MSRRAWLTLLGLLVLSLALAFVIGWGMRNFGKTFWVSRPGFGFASPERGFESHPRLSPPWRPFFTRLSPLWILGRVLASEISLFLIGALGLLLFPKRTHALLSALSLKGRTGNLLGIGFLSLLLILALFVLAAFSLVGLLFLPALGLLLSLAAALGLIGVTWRIGVGMRDLARLPDRQPLLELALGTLTLFSVGSLPIVGGLALLLAGLWGLGAVVATRLGTIEMPVQQSDAQEVEP